MGRVNLKLSISGKWTPSESGETFEVFNRVRHILFELG
jgi:hypothetical protein